MTSFLLTLFLVAVVIYILWVLLKPRKKHSQKKVVRKKIASKTKPALKHNATEKKQETLPANTDSLRKRTAEQMKKDPEIVSRVIRHWLNQK
ncbi:MAG: hypothetical protein H8E32_11675 [Nitrospinae bacterium]|nr:hypothetical protein [Nitrospinota bacterium]